MKFDIDTEPTQKKKKTNNKQKIYYILLIFFIFVFMILLITYLVLSSGNKKKVTAPPPVVTEKSTIKIYNENSNNRPIAYMIDNNIGDAKHSGLQNSYLNYEIIVEGGLTRIMAIYKDMNVPLIGPIRSARHYFLDYALESDAVFVHYGWSPKAETDIKSLDIDNINGLTDPEPFRRDEKSVAPHNVFTNIEYTNDYMEKKKYNDETSNWKLFNISADEIDLGKDETTKASKVSMTYSSNEYRTYVYDESNKYYIRSQNGSPHLDRKTNEQLHYKNIIIMKVENTQLDNEGRQDLKTIGNGEGYYITNGHYRKINWSKESRQSKTNYTYEDGSSLVLNDGNIFVQIVPINSNITIE